MSGYKQLSLSIERVYGIMVYWDFLINHYQKGKKKKKKKKN